MQTLKIKGLPKTDPQVIAFAEAKKIYAYTLAREECLKDRLAILNKPLWDASDKGLITDDEWAEEVTDNEFLLGLPEAQKENIKAANVVIAVAKEILRRVASKAQWEAMAPVWDAEKNWSVRDKVLDLALHYNPTL